MSSAFIRVLVALCLTAMLAPTAQACEFFCTNLRVTHPFTRATAPGETTAVVSMKFDEVRSDDRLIAVRTPIATGAQLGGQGARARIDFPIPKDQETWLSEPSTYLLLTGLKHPLQVGRSYPLTLVFERGGVMEAEVEVDFAEPFQASHQHHKH